MGGRRKLRIPPRRDEPDILLLLQAMLARLSGGGGGRRRARGRPPHLERYTADVAVVDYMMPGMDGLGARTGPQASTRSATSCCSPAYNVDPRPEIDHYLPKAEVARLERPFGRSPSKGLAR